MSKVFLTSMNVQIFVGAVYFGACKVFKTSKVVFNRDSFSPVDDLILPHIV